MVSGTTLSRLTSNRLEALISKQTLNSGSHLYTRCLVEYNPQHREMKRLKLLEQENVRLKKLVAASRSHKAMLQNDVSFEACSGPAPGRLSAHGAVGGSGD